MQLLALAAAVLLPLICLPYFPQQLALAAGGQGPAAAGPGLESAEAGLGGLKVAFEFAKGGGKVLKLLQSRGELARAPTGPACTLAASLRCVRNGRHGGIPSGCQSLACWCGQV
jgi:hypothetical protein